MDHRERSLMAHIKSLVIKYLNEKGGTKDRIIAEKAGGRRSQYFE